MRKTRMLALCAIFSLAGLAAAAGQAPAAKPSLQTALHARFASELERVAERPDGVLGYYIEDLGTGETFGLRPDLVFPTASSIKLAVLLELMRQAQQGRLSLDEKHTIRRSETVAGDPILYMLGDGTATMNLRDIATFMVVLSDNSATNILIDRVGMESVNEGLVRLGLKETHLRRHMIDLEAARRGNENVSTPRELGLLLEKVRSEGVLDATYTKAYFDLLRLPKDSLFNKALPAGAVIADKPGALEGVRCDAGIVEVAGHPFVMSVMATYLADNEEGERAIGEIARKTYEYFAKLGRASAYGRFIEEK